MLLRMLLMIGTNKLTKFSIAAILFTSSISNGHTMHTYDPEFQNKLWGCMERVVDEVKEKNRNAPHLPKQDGTLVKTYEGDENFEPSHSVHEKTHKIKEIANQLKDKNTPGLWLLNEKTNVKNSINFTKSGDSLFGTSEGENTPTSYCFNIAFSNVINSHIERTLDNIEKKNHQSTEPLKDVTNVRTVTKSNMKTTRRTKVD